MTENEAIIRFDFIRCALLGGTKPHIMPNEENIGLVDAAIKALEEVQQYRQIGTVEECRAAVDKWTVMKPIRMDKCTCPSCGTHNEVWKKRRNTLPSDIVYCWHCGQAVEIKRSDEE